MRTTPVLVIVLSLAACGGSEKPAPPAASAPRAPVANPSEIVVRGRKVVSDNHAIIQSGAVGPLRIGVWRRPAMSLVYPVGATQGAPGEDLIAVRGIGRDTITLAFIDDTLRRVIVTRPGPHTADSIEVGTPLSRVTAMPGAHAVASHGATVVTLPAYCGVEFSSAADTMIETRRKAAAPAGDVVRTITVGECTSGAPAP